MNSEILPTDRLVEESDEGSVAGRLAVLAARADGAFSGWSVWSAPPT